MSAVYWNTTSLTGRELASAVAAATCQDAAILAIFIAQGAPLSPSQVREHCARMGRDWLLTSVRRSITNLTARKLLIRTGDKVRGAYGMPEHLWALAGATA